jgi:acetyl esterase/lipase
MTSLESKQIRSAVVRNSEPVDAPLEVQRQEWEAAVEAVNQTLKVTITPVDLNGVPGEWVTNEQTTEEGVILHLHGGGLALATLVKLRDEGIVLPAAAFFMSAWVDLAHAGPSMQTHAQLDPLTTYEGLHQAAQYYLGQLEPVHPLASPLYADLHGLPPLLIQVGEHEILLSDSLRLAEKAEAAGVKVQLEVWDEMWHVWHGWADLPEAQEAMVHIAQFIQQQLKASG